MIRWLKDLFAVVRAYRKGREDDQSTATRAVFLWADGRTQILTLHAPLGIVRLPSVYARWWKEGEAPEPTRLHTFRLKDIDNWTAFYIEDKGSAVTSKVCERVVGAGPCSGPVTAWTSHGTIGVSEREHWTCASCYATLFPSTTQTVTDFTHLMRQTKCPHGYEGTKIVNCRERLCHIARISELEMIIVHASDTAPAATQDPFEDLARYRLRALTEGFEQLSGPYLETGKVFEFVMLDEVPTSESRTLRDEAGSAGASAPAAPTRPDRKKDG